MPALTNRLSLLPLAVCLSMAAVLLAACGGEDPAAGTPATAHQSAAAPTAAAEPPKTMVEVGHEAGQMAPGFMLTTVEGENVSLQSLQGRPTVLYFYATW